MRQILRRWVRRMASFNSPCVFHAHLRLHSSGSQFLLLLLLFSPESSVPLTLCEQFLLCAVRTAQPPRRPFLGRNHGRHLHFRMASCKKLQQKDVTTERKSRLCQATIEACLASNQGAFYSLNRVNIHSTTYEMHSSMFQSTRFFFIRSEKPGVQNSNVDRPPNYTTMGKLYSHDLNVQSLVALDWGMPRA